MRGRGTVPAVTAVRRSQAFPRRRNAQEPPRRMVRT